MATQDFTKGFQKAIWNIRDQQQVRVETAFVHWYLNTRFEQQFDKKVTDGPDDGGIDAVVKAGETYFVVQSEFCNELFAGKNNPSPLIPKKYAQFDGLPDTFRDSSLFEAFLKTVEPSLHSIYQEVEKTFKKTPSNVVWEITTLHTRSRAGEGRLRNIDSANIKYASDNLRLYELSLEGATPPAKPLRLKFTEHFIVDDADMKIKSYVVQAYLGNFIDYIESDPEFRVLARNVRSELQDKSAKEIKDEIKETYKKKPWEFWYSHNGITIVCDRAPIEEGNTIRLISPYIINGAQTIHALRGLQVRNKKAKVLVRVIEIPPGGQDIKNFINSIIVRTNQQNKMYAYDLRANDNTQVKLAHDFLTLRVFYERRRGDWDLKKRIFQNQGINRLKSTQLAQILVTCDESLGGVATAKSRIEDIFSDDSDYRSAFQTPFSEIFFKYQLWMFVKDALKTMKSKSIRTRERNHAVLSCLAIVSSCAASSIKFPQWTEAVQKSPSKLTIENSFSKNLAANTQNIFKECWKIWRKENKQDETLSPNNFFKTRQWIETVLKKCIPKFQNRIQNDINLALR